MRSASLILILSLSAPVSIAGQTIPSPYRYVEESQSVTLFGGYLYNDAGERDLGPHSGPLVGARYGIRFAGPLSGELGASFIPTQRTVHVRGTSTDDPLTPVGDVDAALAIAEAGLRFQITGARTWNGFAPYIAASAGLVADLAGRDAAEKEIPKEQRLEFGPAFAVGLSAGTDWFLNQRLSIRVAGQGGLWRMTIPEGLLGREESEWLRSLGGTVGLALHF